MNNLILLIIFLTSLILNYLAFYSKKNALELVNDMGIGYNLGDTFNCCNAIEENYPNNEEIKLFGTTLPTKKILKEIRKNGFKTIGFQVLYTNHIFNNDKINPEWIQKIKELINLIKQLNMYLILSIKHSKNFWQSERRKAKKNYINFWMEIAKELIYYDDHLVLESMYEIGYLKYLDNTYNYYDDKDYLLSQDFINIIRNSGGLNIERLLIIPLISSDYELNLFYYFPFDEYNSINILEPINLYDKRGYFEEIFL